MVRLWFLAILATFTMISCGPMAFHEIPTEYLQFDAKKNDGSQKTLTKSKFKESEQISKVEF